MKTRRWKQVSALLCGAAGLWIATASPLQAQDDAHPVTVRYSEGTVHGFLELRTDQDTPLAHGDLLQVPGDSTLESRMVFHFPDKSLFEETTVFTQHHVFRMESYHLVQRGPAFSADLDASLSRDGRYVVTSTSHKDGKVDRYDGQLDLPSDVSNGLPVVLARNLRVGDTATVHLVAFTPKPRLIGLQIAFASTDTVMLGAHAEPTAEFVLKPKLGALTAFFAKLLGKLPPDSHIWIVMDQVPTFMRFEGPMYSGPVWHLSMATPVWPKSAPPRP
jgi:hypothetical protein